MCNTVKVSLTDVKGEGGGKQRERERGREREREREKERERRKERGSIQLLLTFFISLISLHLAQTRQRIVQLIEKCVEYCTQKVLQQSKQVQL